MKRVAYICADPGVPVFGTKGCSVHVQEVTRAMSTRGWDVTLFAARTGGAAPADLASMTLVELPNIAESDSAIREQKLLGRNDHLSAMLQDAGEFDLVYERYSIWSHAGIDYALASGVPSVLEVNAPLIDEQIKHRSLHDSVAAKRVLNRIVSGAGAILAVSREVAAYLAQQGADPSKIHVISNGVAVERFSSGAVALPDHPVIGFVGTMKPWHGLDTLVEAFIQVRSHLPESKLLLVGDGPELPRILERLASAGMKDSAVATGAVTPSRMPELLASMTIAVAPYPAGDFYFSPLKVFEYMAAGRAIVASSIGQICDVLAHRQTALLCKPGDSNDLAKAILELASDRSLASELGNAARRVAASEHSWNGVISRIEQIALATVGASP